MADYQIDRDEVGIYEVALTAGQKCTIAIEGRGFYVTSNVQVTVHESTAPVYARIGNNISVQDQKAVVVPTGTWVDLTTGSGQDATIALITSGTATVSVARS